MSRVWSDDDGAFMPGIVSDAGFLPVESAIEGFLDKLLEVADQQHYDASGAALAPEVPDVTVTDLWGNSETISAGELAAILSEPGATRDSIEMAIFDILAQRGSLDFDEIQLAALVEQIYPDEDDSP